LWVRCSACRTINAISFERTPCRITDDSAHPGVGRVEGIKRQDAQWVVVTARGLITSAP
jgi:hypothetical protein